MTASPENAWTGNDNPNEGSIYASSVPATRTVLHRMLWGAGDQVIFSTTSFALAIAIGRTGSSEEFGAFALVYLLYTLVLGSVEALTAEVVGVRGSDLDRSSQGRMMAEATGCAFVAGLIVSIAGLLFVLSSHGLFRSIAPAILLPAPLLFVQDVWRYSLFSWNRPTAAFLNDAVWALTQALVFILLAMTGNTSPTTLLWAWSGAGCVAALVGAAQTSVVPAFGAARAWMSKHGSIGFRFAGEYLVLVGSGQSVLVVVALVGGLNEAAGFRGAQLLYGPVQVLVNAVRLAATPLAVQARTRGRQALASAGALVAFGGAAIAGSWTVALELVPESWLATLLGESWIRSRPLIAPFGVLTVAIGVSLGGLVILRALEAAHRSFRARALFGSLVLVLGSVGSLLGGAIWAANGVAIAGLFGMATFWWEAKGALFELGSTPD